jgi:hypothetical protein
MSHSAAHHQVTPTQIEEPDAWHSHLGEEPPQQAHAENINAPQVLIYGIAGFIIIVVCVVATIIYFNAYSNQMMISRESYPEGSPGDRPSGVPSIQAEALANRAAIVDNVLRRSTPVIDGDTTTVLLPIDRAFERVVQRYSR